MSFIITFNLTMIWSHAAVSSTVQFVDVQLKLLLFFFCFQYTQLQSFWISDQKWKCCKVMLSVCNKLTLPPQNLSIRAFSLFSTLVQPYTNPNTIFLMSRLKKMLVLCLVLLYDHKNHQIVVVFNFSDGFSVSSFDIFLLWIFHRLMTAFTDAFGGSRYIAS